MLRRPHASRAPSVRHAATLALAAALVAPFARGDTLVPPWNDPDDVPLPSWARSVVPKRAEIPIVSAPGKIDAHRGTILASARLPLFGAKRAASCNGRWLEVGPLAWVCSDLTELSADPPWSLPERARWAAGAGPDGLPFRYYFVGHEGASGFDRLETALDDAPAQELDQGFVVATVEERTMHDERWVRTNHGKWIAERELSPVRPPGFHGEALTSSTLDFAWVTSDRAAVRGAPKTSGPALASLTRFQVVHVREERALPGGAMVRIAEDVIPAGVTGKSAAPAEPWVLARDLARPVVTAPPDEVGPDERWIDVDLAGQTLVAYEGKRPVYATLVSTGRGPEGSDTATPKGTHRIWVKLTTTNMDNLEHEDADSHYLIEDVPYVQFFDHAVALHGAFWHQDFGRVHSHGCVNLAPLDARWLFGFTLPHLPAGWSAVFPSTLEPGTAIRVR